MKTYNEFQAVFDGNTYWAGWMKEEYDGHQHRYFVKKPVKNFPFIKKWIPFISGTIKMMEDYEEVLIFDVINNKISERKIRIYHFGLSDYELVAKKANNMQLLRENESLRIKAEFWEATYTDMRIKFDQLSMEDSSKQWLKDWFDFIDDKLKPGSNIAMANKLAEQGRKRS